MTASSTSLAIALARGFHFGGGHGGADFVLLLVGLAFAGLLVWAIERGGRSAA